MHRSRLTRCDEMYLEESQLYAASDHRPSLPPEITREFSNRLHQLGLQREDEELGAIAARHAQCMRTSVVQLLLGLALLAVGVPVFAYKSSAWIVHYLELESGMWEVVAMGGGIAVAAVLSVRVVRSIDASSECVIQSLMVVAYRMRDLDRKIDVSR